MKNLDREKSVATDGEMGRLAIDLRAFFAQHGRSPSDDEEGLWTFIIDGRPTPIYGRYDEARALANEYARAADGPSKPDQAGDALSEKFGT